MEALRLPQGVANVMQITPAPPTMPSQKPQPPSSQPPSQEAQDRARAYKSRNKRPCDFCRYKKAACHLDSAPPCELCIRYGKDCTFVESPAKRRRPNEDQSQQSQNFEQQPQQRNGMDMHNELLSWEPPVPPFMPPMLSDFTFDPMAYQNSLVLDQYDPSNSGLPLPVSTSPQSATLQWDSTAGEPSLDGQASSNSQIVGLSGESDPYLLRNYQFDANNEATFQQLRMRRMGDNDGIPMFFMIQQNRLASKAQPSESSENLRQWRREVDEMIPEEVGKRLIVLFYRYVQPYFPVLSREHGFVRDGVCEPRSVPTCILAAIYGHALPFCAWDEQLCIEVYTPPSADALFRIAWQSAVPNFHTPSLSVVQALLLLVQRRPTNKHVADTPAKWVMMSTAVSIAQALGLNVDPSDWPLPLWEQKLRKRLAWAVFIQDKWLSLNFGRSSHLNNDDWDVDDLTLDDLETPDQAEEARSQHFLCLCRLSDIVDDILRDLFSLRATRSLCHSLEATLEVAKPLRIRLTQWFQNLPTNLMSTPESRKAHELNGHGSLHLAYITAKIELFRAMLRPPVTDANAQAVTALRSGALTVAKEVFDFVETLEASHLEAFWASYSRTNFTIASNFMLLLFVSSPTLPDAKECLSLLDAWRGLLRIKSRSSDLLNLALLRLDAIYVAGLDRLIQLSPAALQAFQEQSKS